MKKGVEFKVPMIKKTVVPKISSLRPPAPSKPIKIDLKDKKKVNPRQIQVEVPANAKTSSAPTNPFQIDLVLDTLFTFVKRRDLPACRLTSKNWNLKIIPRFREEFEIYLCGVSDPICRPHSFLVFPDVPELKQERSLESFVKLMRTSLCIPYTKFRVDLNAKGNYRDQFFKVCGPIMTHVTLQNWTFEPDPYFHESPSDYFLIENLKEMFKFSRNLKSLRFYTPMFLPKNPSIRLFDNGLTNNLPSLKFLSFRDFKLRRGFGKEPAFIDELIAQTNVYSALVSPERASYVSSLTTDSYRIQSSGFLDRMEQCGVKLKKLFITDSELYDPAPLFRLIELQKDNLVEFTYKLDEGRCGYGWNAPDGGPELPRMPRLKILRFHTDNSRRYSTTTITGMALYEKFPNLEIFSWCNGERILDLDLIEDQCCPKLHSMELHFYTLDTEGFARMAEMYSATLTSLKLNTGQFINPEFLGLIWTHLTNLQDFELKFLYKACYQKYDSLFTGISAEDCVKIQNDPMFWNFMNTKGKASEKREKLRELTRARDSSIADLKNLNRVSLKFPGVGLTDITGYLGLYLLENLKHVHIDFCEFTKTCCEELKKELKLESWVFRATNGSFDVRNRDYTSPCPFGIRRQIIETEEIVPPCPYPYKEKEYLLGL